VPSNVDKIFRKNTWPLESLNPRILVCPPEAGKPQTGLYALVAGFSKTNLEKNQIINAMEIKSIRLSITFA
jgi:hypothetical protein